MNSNASIITLTTDFGYGDLFVAEMKGVILSINPQAVIVDITHDVEPFDIVEAALIIGYSSAFFPSGTIHVVVVDPGVGSDRKPIIVRAGGNYFVGPDNGVFSRITPDKSVEIAGDKYMIRRDSPTFQGRDIFAPVAAWLSRGVLLSEFGPEIAACKSIDIAGPELIGNELRGEVIHVDRFGNIITNITETNLSQIGKEYQVYVKSKPVGRAAFYSQARPGVLNCLVNSSGHLEIFSYRNSAASQFGISKGDIVVVSCMKD
jgi:S-adenosylmethionine hydrolase